MMRFHAATSRRSSVYCLPISRLSNRKSCHGAGLYRGHDGARQFFAKLGSHINSTLDVERLIDAENHVVAIGWTQGTVNATGASYRGPYRSRLARPGWFSDANAIFD